jgi:hypothetical protein
MRAAAVQERAAQQEATLAAQTLSDAAGHVMSATVVLSEATLEAAARKFSRDTSAKTAASAHAHHNAAAERSTRRALDLSKACIEASSSSLAERAKAVLALAHVEAEVDLQTAKGLQAFHNAAFSTAREWVLAAVSGQ